MEVPQLDGINSIDEILFMALATVDDVTELEIQNLLKLPKTVKIELIWAFVITCNLNFFVSPFILVESIENLISVYE